MVGHGTHLVFSMLVNGNLLIFCSIGQAAKWYVLARSTPYRVGCIQYEDRENLCFVVLVVGVSPPRPSPELGFVSYFQRF